MSEQIEILHQVVGRLEGVGLEYMLSGSMALSLYAAPRMTRDIDIVIALGAEDVDTLVALFEKDFYLDSETVASAVDSRRMFNIIHEETVSKLDFIVRKETPYRIEEFSNRRRLRLGTREVWVVGPEDLVLSKLVWALDSGSTRQLDDVRSVLEASDVDGGYLDRWASELGVSELLERCRS